MYLIYFLQTTIIANKHSTNTLLIPSSYVVFIYMNTCINAYVYLHPFIFKTVKTSSSGAAKCEDVLHQL